MDQTKGAWELKLNELKLLYHDIVNSAHNPTFASKLAQEEVEFNYYIHGLPKEYGMLQDYMAFHHFAGVRQIMRSARNSTSQAIIQLKNFISAV